MTSSLQITCFPLLFPFAGPAHARSSSHFTSVRPFLGPTYRGCQGGISLSIKDMYYLQSFILLNHLHLTSIQINHQLDATISPVYYLTFIYSSTCVGRPHAHHQELSNCRSSLWFYLRSVVIAVLLVVVGPVIWYNRSDHDQQHCYQHAPKVKPEAATAVELLMMGVRTPETCWTVHKRQVINLRNCCI